MVQHFNELCGVGFSTYTLNLMSTHINLADDFPALSSGKHRDIIHLKELMTASFHVFPRSFVATTLPCLVKNIKTYACGIALPNNSRLILCAPVLF